VSRYPDGADSWQFKPSTKGTANGGTPRQEGEPSGTSSNLTVHFIDVGQGDAILVIYENWTVMVDSGNRYSSIRDKVEGYLTSLNITRITLAIATHADADHIGQFTNLMHDMTIDQFWVNGQPGTSQTW